METDKKDKICQLAPPSLSHNDWLLDTNKPQYGVIYNVRLVKEQSGQWEP